MLTPYGTGIGIGRLNDTEKKRLLKQINDEPRFIRKKIVIMSCIIAFFLGIIINTIILLLI